MRMSVFLSAIIDITWAEGVMRPNRPRPKFKKIDRSREGKAWAGYFRIHVTDVSETQRIALQRKRALQTTAGKSLLRERAV